MADDRRPAGAPAFGAWGFDLAGMDASIRPGADFCRHANGRWLDATVIPEDRSRWSVSDVLSDRADEDVRALLEGLQAVPPVRGSSEERAADFFAAFLDVDAIERRGMEPAREALDRMAQASTHEDIARLMLDPATRTTSPLLLGIALDPKDPNRWALSVTHAGLGLPEREYYLGTDDSLATLRTAYVAHVQRVLELAGRPDAADAAAAVMELETRIARCHWQKARRRDRDATYNPRSLQELVDLAADFPWEAALEAAGLPAPDGLIVRELDAMGPLASLFRSTSVKTWRAHLTFHYLSAHASVLPGALDAATFDFYGRTLSGARTQRERWRRAVAATNRALGDAVGKLYVERHLPASAREAMLVLVENLRSAFARRLETVPWMTEATRAAALGKLQAFTAKIGQPARWRDDSGLDVRRDDAFGNAIRSGVFDWERDVARLGAPSDRHEWFMPPQVVNAYYNPAFNEIVFPAAILQPPFFDPAADPAVNYGAIGGVIGHEMGHGFDDQGAKSDGRGVLREWWSAEDVAAFGKLGDALAEQYSGFEPVPGLRLDGRVSLGENLADLGGLTLALEAYRLSLGGRESPVLDGLTGEQRLFLGWAQVWRSVEREESLRRQVMVGPHSPPRYRINGVVRNLDAWHEAFDVREGDPLYLEPAARVRVW